MNVRAVGVVGLGTMGSGIAQVCVSSGFPTIGREPTKELAEQAREAIAARLGRAAERGRLTGRDRDEALARLTVTTQVGDLRDCDLVVEAAPERLGVKLQLFAELATFVGTDTLLATNTSALSVTEIAHATPLPERVLGLHFFNPAPVLPLVEVVRTGLTSDAVVETATAFVERLGKTPVVCGDTPGFIVNRLLIPVLNDAVRLLEEESAEAEAIDTAMRLGTSWPIGPLALIDLIGVDVHVAASEALWHACREPRLNPPGRLLSMLQAGHLGRKTGQGFYTYTA